jgi:hypothetical protein
VRGAFAATPEYSLVITQRAPVSPQEADTEMHLNATQIYFIGTQYLGEPL